jgi:hypothetical protein
MNDLKIQFISDLHLEMTSEGFPTFPVTAPHLALLGDIGRVGTRKFAGFIRDIAPKYITVLVVASNHEFYRGVYEDVKDEIRKITDQHANVHFLDCNVLEVQGVKIIGCTLWTHVPLACQSAVGSSINDYRLIYCRDMLGIPRPFTVAETNELHRVEHEFILREIESSRETGKCTVVLTHHAPLMKGTSDPKFFGTPTSHAFSTDMADLMGSPVVAWLHGHTHFNSPGTRMKGTLVTANQKGYIGESVGLAFRMEAFLHIVDSTASVK